MAFRICPICNARNSESQGDCANCGADLRRVLPWQEGVGNYGPERNDLADLAESRLRWRGGTCLTLLALALAAMLCAGVVLQVALWLLANSGMVEAPTATAVPPQSLVVTDTPMPTLFLPTVTSTPVPPPTASHTPTRAPCLQRARSGDSLIAIVTRCGHRDLEVLELVLEANNLAAAEFIQAGQELVIPWPTATFDPNATSRPPAQGARDAPDDTGGEPEAPRFPGDLIRSTPTLQAGVMWHRVRPGETIVGLAFRYGTDLKVLSELNPEVAFSQCDFGQASGGPSCVVTIFENQQLRVPAPTPTPTQSQTPSGIATATPTAVVNEPVLFSPPDNRNFSGDELVTLRWVASGSLTEGEVWRVVVENLTSIRAFAESTVSQSFVLPVEWKETRPGWHVYRWRVQLVKANGDIVESGARQFLWETRT